MTIVSEADVFDFLEVSADDTFGNIAATHISIEQFVKSFCDREFETATFKEEFIHNDLDSVFVKEVPITQVNKVAVGACSVIIISNTNTQTTAVVNVTSSGITLTLDGANTIGTFTFDANPTVTAMVTAINNSGDGWFATGVSGFGNYKSSEMALQWGLETINNTKVALIVPAKALNNIQVVEGIGEIRRLGGFNNARYGNHGFDYVHGSNPAGFVSGQGVNNFEGINSKIYVSYIGGYSAITMPKDLQLAIKVMIQFIYNKLKDGSFGVESCSIAGISQKFSEMPRQAQSIINMYKVARI